ncbi:hypothetical protein COOONC_20933 [Cooperia oncophora]
MADGFWLFEGLEEEPYGLLPLANLAGKGGPTSTKYVDRLGSYQWLLTEETSTILVPGMPVESFFWPGGKLQQDHGVIIYDVNHLRGKLLTFPRHSFTKVVVATSQHETSV